MSANKIDVLAFAPHPDDVEIFCGGLLLKLKAQGHSTAVVDLTQGELSTGGDLPTRAKEANAAAEVLGLSYRKNLHILDGAIDSSPDNVSKLVEVLRELKPKLILAPYFEGRHPDHVATSDLVSRAVFFSGVKKHSIDAGSKHHPLQLVYYQMRHAFKPTFIVDTSSVHSKKLEAVACYQSQINPQSGNAEDQTLLNSSKTLENISAKDRYYGAMIGTEFAEAYFIKSALRIDDPLSHFINNPTDQAHIFPEVQ